MTERLFTLAEVELMIAAAVAEERAACVELVAAEPELEGPMPEHLKGKGEEYLARLAVRATKRNLIAAIQTRS